MSNLNALAPMSQYMSDESNKSNALARASGLAGAAGIGASFGAMPASGGISLLGLPPSVAALILSIYENNRQQQMSGGQRMWNNTGMPQSPHDPGRGIGLGGPVDY